MAKSDEDRLLDHSYDGIQEYDNPLPRWWLWIFYATIVFVPIYYLVPGDIGAGKGMIARYEAEVAAYKASAPPPAAWDAAAFAARAKDPALLASGKTVFETNCAACHRADGGGLIGPNLTDDAWIHGGQPAQIHVTVTQGVLAKGMPSWERLLKPEQVDAVIAYVLSLHGTNPKDGKAPEGTADTTAVAAPAAPAPGA
ncbi:MAG: c-type cytochrome [Gemmatimonadaceae bacterium]|nr:c-type cytochrome [Gemmatimonadaceae bacterium]